MLPVTVGGYIGAIKDALLIIFNVGIAARTIKMYLDGMTDENGPNKKKIGNLIKALIVIDSIGVMVNLMQNYYI